MLNTVVTSMKIRVGVYSQKEIVIPSVNLIKLVKNIETLSPAAIVKKSDCILKNIIFSISEGKSRKNITNFDSYNLIKIDTMGRIAESELIINGDGSIFHLHITPEDLADTVMLVGDPGRVDMVAQFFEEIEVDKTSREFHTVTGRYNGKRISVISTGIGCDNIDIVVNELDALKNIDFNTREVKPVHTPLNILRVGTSGAIQPEVPLGSFVFSHYSVGFDALLNWYGGRANIADPVIEGDFLAHMGDEWVEKKLPIPYFVKASENLIELFSDSTVKGMTISAGGFYGPQCRVLRLPIAIPDMMDRLESFRSGEWKITNFEMEGSALAGLARNLGHNAATVCCIIAARYAGDSNTDYKPRVKELIKLSLDKLAQITK